MQYLSTFNLLTVNYNDLISFLLKLTSAATTVISVIAELSATTASTPLLKLTSWFAIATTIPVRGYPADGRLLHMVYW